MLTAKFITGWELNRVDTGELHQQLWSLHICIVQPACQSLAYLTEEEHLRLVLLQLILNLPQRQSCSCRHLRIDHLACRSSRFYGC